MKQAQKRKVVFHGAYADKYLPTDEVYADSMFGLCNLLFKQMHPDLLNESALMMVIESGDGEMTELFDKNQILTKDQHTIHIMPNPDGAYIEIVIAIIIAIIAIGAAILMAPKLEEASAVSQGGSTFNGTENIVGQGGVMPVVLGRRLVGSRVVSHGVDSVLWTGVGSGG